MTIPEVASNVRHSDCSQSLYAEHVGFVLQKERFNPCLWSLSHCKFVTSHLKLLPIPFFFFFFLLNSGHKYASGEGCT